MQSVSGPRLMRLAICVLACGAAFAVCAADAARPDIAGNSFRFEFSAAFQTDNEAARARILVAHKNSRVRELSFRMPDAKYTRVSAAGELQQQGDRWIWRPPVDGGAFEYSVRIPSMRGRGPDARITESWVIMRLEDLFPPARARAVKSATGAGQLELHGPENWSFETAYGDVAGKSKSISRADRIYPQPRGWMIGGELGIRRERIADRRVVVAAPRAAGLRRMDVLTFLQWTLPKVVEILPGFPDRLLIVGAPPPMWLGALSAPGSLYLHVDRPLVSENGTSTLVHELVHVGGMHSAAPGSDWIVEGLAEYYALEVLFRSGGVTDARRERVLRELARWAERDNGGLRDPSKGADTARAVLLFAALAEELQDGGASIDEVARRIAAPEISTAALIASARDALGRDSEVLTRELEKGVKNPRGSGAVQDPDSRQ